MTHVEMKYIILHYIRGLYLHVARHSPIGVYLIRLKSRDYDRMAACLQKVEAFRR